MKLQRSTGVLLGVAIALVATVAIIETTKKNRPEKGQPLYAFAEEDVDAFTITRSDTTLAFEKTDGTWQMTAPEDAPADPSAIAFFLNIITTDPITETILATTAQLDDYGLDAPRATVEMTVFEESHTLALGDEDFSGSSMYVMTTEITPETEPGELYLMPNSLRSGIGRRIDQWIAAEDSEEAVEEGLEPESEETTEPSASEESEPSDALDSADEDADATGEESEAEISEPDSEETTEPSASEESESPDASDSESE
ncbi:DUF4340 domain-containing protein [Leptothoe kymatousa]|uniref:DUF4340 domain-containing protein n=1 Tax=Leptothoe kymatousa TAU-MAC 1615 TaxID=2364775 RepID=A0ABS5XZV8_9CYAN|nr:DUF4340 domain-containing protein [Leptothoe kymatousa]MBT9311137.1 DUF4340 domain-containing protein [Leptothoe kymatousa TAU-MAC 1615]